MKFVIKHEIRGRLRVHLVQNRMTCREADILEYYLNSREAVISARVQERTMDAIIKYKGKRTDIIAILKRFQYSRADIPENFLENTGRELNRQYQDKLVNQLLFRMGSKLFLPDPVRVGIITIKSIKYIWQGLKVLFRGRIEVPVLDGMAIGVSVVRRDFDTAGSVMFLLGIGEILEEWTHKKSVDDLARSMSLNIEKVWRVIDGKEVLTTSTLIERGDRLVVHMGNVIPFDGVVLDGEAMVNQASLTGESLPVEKRMESYVYAGTVVEEGELTIEVKETSGSGKFDKIVTMIEETEKLKSSLEGKAEHLADKLVPYTLAGAGAAWAFTRNTTKMLSVLMVDYSCALKLAMPIAVLSAIRESGKYNIMVKGGRYLENIAEAETIVFDKTGTLTKAQPIVVDVVSFNGKKSEELLKIAACMEEHFPHSMAKAVVDAAKEHHIEHEEMHSKVEYIVAHGIVTTIEGKRAVIGSYHFVFEDEDCVIPEGMEDRFHQLPKNCSRLYLAIENVLEGVICIEDPLREEAADVIGMLRKSGIKKIVMMTGDSEHTARTIATKIGVDEYYSGVLPEDKAKYVEREKAQEKKVIMVGDGINDSPALSASDVGIAISDGAQIAREIADITIGADNLYEIVTLKNISNALMKRIDKNYKFIVGFNTGLILLGVSGILQPTTTALLHNTSTLAISVESMKNLIPE